MPNIVESSFKPNIRFKPLMVSILVGILICLVPRPDSVPINGWYLLAIFVSIIVACALGAVSLGLASFIGIFILTCTHIITTKEAFSSYSEGLIWLIVCADCLSIGITKTGLGKRLAYNIIRKIGRRTIGVGYSLVLCEGILSMLIPSATSRSTGIILPIAKALSEAYGSRAGDGTEKKAGTFLMLTAIHSNLISSSLFVTSSAVNLLAIAMARDLGVKTDITFGLWLLVGIVPVLINFIVVPVIIYFICPPEIKKLDNVEKLMSDNLRQLGSMKKSEKFVVGVFIIVVALWIFGSKLNIDATTVSVLGLIILIASGIVSWEEFTGKRGIWNLVIWLGAFMMMAGQLNKLGIIKWISSIVTNYIQGISWLSALVIICISMYYLHYLFASNMVHFTALFTAFLTILLSIGAPPVLSVFLLVDISALSSGLTHYGIAQGGVYFSEGYVEQRTWWFVGFIVSIVHLVILLVFGMAWWKLIGMY
ncbi:MAG: anion permease [Clostridium sp.]|jgi:DASS family divalent anion:Na+ symporter|uniref:DASS family sodium-coupled anion symporter n=1 Tax=Clostridium sp. TaxID=1506 RepID=UPI0025BF06A8|nr:DASS family sodium-coupled anion symporter [Clostridium sp.]MCH3965087.1 anion permease [Clostridium sp.]MCI1714308.1 anion permease [Clostridium sp.]MCI1798570.1 anion permease [Clostridium sp.]MCI1812699.1 anion permease [Clostridium sp.]MCI1869379.1 anion permease [Clostridium sp.]